MKDDLAGWNQRWKTSSWNCSGAIWWCFEWVWWQWLWREDNFTLQDFLRVMAIQEKRSQCGIKISGSGRWRGSMACNGWGSEFTFGHVLEGLLAYLHKGVNCSTGRSSLKLKLWGVAKHVDRNEINSNWWDYFGSIYRVRRWKGWELSFEDHQH